MLLLLFACSGSRDEGPPDWSSPSPGDRIEYRVTLEREDISQGWTKLKLDTTELAASAEVVAVEGHIAWVELAVTQMNGEALDHAPVARPLLLPVKIGEVELAPVTGRQAQTLAGREFLVSVDRQDLRPQDGLLRETWRTALAESLYLCDGVVRTQVESPRRDGVVERRVVELIDLRWGGGPRMDPSLPRFFEPGSYSVWTRVSAGRTTLLRHRYEAVAGELRRYREVRALTDHTNRDCIEHEEEEWCSTGEDSVAAVRLNQLLDDLVELALKGAWAPVGLPDSVPSKQGYLPVMVEIEEGVMSVEGRPLEFTARRALALDPLDLDGLPWPERFAPLRLTRSFPHPWQEKGSDEMLLDWGKE